MTCYHPMTAYRAKPGPSNGKWPITFNARDGFIDKIMQIPCGKCIGCRISRVKQWSQRCMDESKLHDENSFITLTYNDENVPLDMSLRKEDFQKFMKRLRKRIWKEEKKRIRFFHCGEYGKPDENEKAQGIKLGRPHHHACIFGWDPKDKIFLKNKKGNDYFNSPTLEKEWPYGFNLVGAVTEQSTAYVARYIVKKIGGEMATDHYQGRQPEYCTMSNRPGIGNKFLDTFKEDFYNRDQYVHSNGKTISKPPKFYDKKMELIDKHKIDRIKYHRVKEAKKNKENDWERLEVKEKLAKIRLLNKQRELENGSSDVYY